MAQNVTGGYRVGRGLTDHIFVDVDGTLLLWPASAGAPRDDERAAAHAADRGEPHRPELLPRVNEALVAELKHWLVLRPGGALVLWSMGGAQHARMARRMCGFSERTDCVAKPDLMIDDAGPDLLGRKHPVVWPHEFKCPQGG